MSDEALRELETATRMYEHATTSYEIAAMRGEVTDQIRAAFHKAIDDHSRALSAYVRARRAEGPTFEQLLRDPTQQFDPNSEVLKSILAYQNAPSSTIGAWKPNSDRWVHGAADD